MGRLPLRATLASKPTMLAVRVVWLSTCHPSPRTQVSAPSSEIQRYPGWVCVTVQLVRWNIDGRGMVCETGIVVECIFILHGCGKECNDSHFLGLRVFSMRNIGLGMWGRCAILSWERMSYSKGGGHCRGDWRWLCNVGRCFRYCRGSGQGGWRTWWCGGVWWGKQFSADAGEFLLCLRRQFPP